MRRISAGVVRMEAESNPLPGTIEWIRYVSGFRTECLECSRSQELVVTQVSAALRFQGNEEGNGRMSSIKDPHMTTLQGSVSLRSDLPSQDAGTGTVSLGLGFP